METMSNTDIGKPMVVFCGTRVTSVLSSFLGMDRGGGLHRASLRDRDRPGPPGRRRPGPPEPENSGDRGAAGPRFAPGQRGQFRRRSAYRGKVVFDTAKEPYPTAAPVISIPFETQGEILLVDLSIIRHSKSPIQEPS